MAKKINYTSEQGHQYEIHGGVYTGFSFTNEQGEKSILGFDTQGDVMNYIEQRESGKPHFCDDLSDIKKSED